LTLWKGLSRLHREQDFPRRHLNQAAFAEARMVEWLAFPTELARVPDTLELMKVVTLERASEGGPFDTYVYRFRTSHRELASRGWMAGVAGPFRRRDAPTADDLGGTFSSFEPWTSRSPEQHARSVAALLDEMAARQQRRPVP